MPKKAITVRALDYLLKPYEESELLLVVEEAMRIVCEREAAAESKTSSSKRRRGAFGKSGGRNWRIRI